MNNLNSKLQEIIDLYMKDIDKDKHISIILNELSSGKYAYIHNEILLKHQDNCVGYLNKFAKDFYERVVEDICGVIGTYKVKNESGIDINKFNELSKPNPILNLDAISNINISNNITQLGKVSASGFYQLF